MFLELSAEKPDVRYAKSGWFSILQNLHLTSWKTFLPGNSTLRDLIKRQTKKKHLIFTVNLKPVQLPSNVAVYFLIALLS